MTFGEKVEERDRFGKGNVWQSPEGARKMITVSLPGGDIKFDYEQAWHLQGELWNWQYVGHIDDLGERG